jgi:hypothetical protein
MHLRLDVQGHGWLPVASLGLVPVFTFWCQLHGSVLGGEAVGFDVSLPWACKVSLGWIIAAFALHRFSAWNPAWPAWLGATAGVAVLTLATEALLLRGDSALTLWFYQRTPLHLGFAALLAGGFFLMRARDAQSSPASGSPGERPSDLVEVMTGTGHTRIRLEDIECLEAERNYINVHTPERTYLLRRTLSSLEESLGSRNFERVHRSIIVNRAKVRERRRGGVLVLHSGREVRVSRAFSKKREEGWSG